MTPLQYINKDLHTAPGWRRPVRRPDLQRVKREERILALKKKMREPHGGTATETIGFFDYSAGAIKACVHEVAEFVRRYPIQTSTAALSGALLISLLIRRR